jgi:hypothetical protein
MRSVLEKMFYKGQARLLVLNAPPEAKSLTDAFGREDLTPLKGKASFVLAFAPDVATAVKAAKTVHKSLEPGGIFWMAYPKARAKQRKSGVDGDSLHALMAGFGFFGDNSLSLDGQWAAMRFKGI